MKKMTKQICLILVLAMLSSILLTGCGNSGNSASAGTNGAPSDSASASQDSGNYAPATDGGEIYTLKAGHSCTIEHPYHKGLEVLRDMLYERSDHHIILEIYPSAQLGNESDLLEGEQLGTVDIAVTSAAPVVNFSPALAILDLPYLFETKEQAFKVLDGEIGQEFWADLEKVGIKGLAFFDLGFMYMHTNSTLVNEPSDLKGLKLRTMENPIYQAFVNSCGATATPMAMGEVYTALQNNTVNGHVTCTATTYTSKWYSVAEYLTHTDQIYSTAPLTMSQKTFDKLPAEYQQLLLECAADTCVEERKIVEQVETEGEAQMVAEGCIISPREDVNIEAYKQIAYDEVWPKYIGTTVDADLVTRIQALIA